MGEACMLHTDGHDVAWSLFLRSVVRAEFRAYIAALQSNAVPGSEQRAASMRAFIIFIITFVRIIYVRT